MSTKTVSAIKKIPLDFLYLLAAAVLVMSGIVPAKELMLSIANEATVSIFCLFIVCKTVVKTNLFHILTAKILARMQSKRLLIPLFAGAFGAFLSPSLYLQKFLPSTLYYPLLLGGSCTLMGSWITLTLNHLLKQRFPESGFSFFEIAIVGIPCLVAGSLYALFDRTALWPYDRALQSKNLSSSKKEWGVLALLALMVLLGACGVPLAWASFGAAAALIIFKITPWKASFEGFSWEFLLLLVSSSVFSSALDNSALAAIIAYPFILLGQLHPLLLLSGIYLFTFLLSHLLFPIVAAVLMFPVVCILAQISAFNEPVSVKALVLTIIFAANFAFLKKRQEIPGFAFGNGETIIPDTKKKAVLSALLFLITIGSIYFLF